MSETEESVHKTRCIWFMRGITEGIKDMSEYLPPPGARKMIKKYLTDYCEYVEEDKHFWEDLIQRWTVQYSRELKKWNGIK